VAHSATGPGREKRSAASAPLDTADRPLFGASAADRMGTVTVAR